MMKQKFYTTLILLSFFFVQVSGQQFFNSKTSADGETKVEMIRAEKGQTITDFITPQQYRSLQTDLNPGYLPEGDYVHRLGYSGDGSMVLQTNAITDNVTIFNAQTMEVLANVDVGDFPVDVACTEDYAIIPCVFADEAWVIDLGDFSIAGTFETGEQPATVEVSHDGSKAFVGCDIDDVLEVINLQTMSHEMTITDFPVALRSASWVTGSGRFYYTWYQYLVSADDNYLITSDYENNILLFDTETGVVSDTIQDVYNITEMNLSGDGDRLIAVTYANPAIVHQIDMETMQVEIAVELTGVGIWGNGVAVNPDGSKAFLGVNGNQTALVRFETGDYTFYPSTQTAFWCDNSFDHAYAISGQYRFTIFEFDTELIKGFYWGINQYLGAASPNSYHAVGVDPARYEGPAFFDYTDPADVTFMGRMPSGEIPEGDVPYRAAVAPDGSKAVVVNNLSENVSIIELEDYTVEAILDMGENCNAVAITHDSKWAVAGGYDLNTVKIIDLETNELVTTVGTGQRPGMIAIAPDDSYAYVGNIKSNSVSFVKLDGANSVNEKTIPVGVIGLSWAANGVRSAVEISPTGEYILVAASFDDNVKVIDTEAQEIVATVTTPDFPLQIAFNGSGSHAVVTHYYDNSYSVIEVDGANTSLITNMPCPDDYPVRLKYNEAKDEISIVHLGSGKTILNIEPETGDVISQNSYPLYGSPLQIDFDFDGLPLVLTSPTEDRNAALLYNDEVYELPASPIHFGYSVDQQVAVVAEGGGGPDYVTVVDWMNTGLDDQLQLRPVTYRPCYITGITPNPANNQAMVSFWISPEISGDAQLSIAEGNGQTIRSIDIESNGTKGEILIDLSDLKAGLYFVTLQAGNKSSTKKLIVR